MPHPSLSVDWLPQEWLRMTKMAMVVWGMECRMVAYRRIDAYGPAIRLLSQGMNALQDEYNNIGDVTDKVKSALFLEAHRDFIRDIRNKAAPERCDMLLQDEMALLVMAAMLDETPEFARNLLSGATGDHVPEFLRYIQTLDIKELVSAKDIRHIAPAFLTTVLLRPAAPCPSHFVPPIIKAGLIKWLAQYTVHIAEIGICDDVRDWRLIAGVY